MDALPDDPRRPPNPDVTVTDTLDTAVRVAIRRNEGLYNRGIEGERAEELVDAARTSLVGTLRSVVYLTPGAYDVLYARRGRRSELGDYRFTVRFHDEGFVVRIVHGYCGVLLTVDRMDAEAFEEAVTALRSLLGEAAH